MDDPRKLSDEELLGRLERFVEEERGRLHAFLSWLGEADRRKVPEKRGYHSTFDYCVRHLKLSEDESYRRIHAARATVIRPELLSALAGGQLSLSAVSNIAPFVRRGDAPEIISRAEGKTARQLDEILAPLRPEPERRDIVRVIAVAPSGSGRETMTPSLRASFEFQGSIALRDAIDRIRELLSHKYPKGGCDELLLEIATEYLDRHDPLRGLPGLLAPVRGGSSIPAGVRRVVWARDAGRCSYVEAGVRCETRRFLELDHVKPRALGGEDTAENLRLLCRAHNDAERRRILGEPAVAGEGRAGKGISGEVRVETGRPKGGRRYAGITWPKPAGPPGTT